MSDKQSTPFWLGFLLASGAIALLYLYLRQQEALNTPSLPRQAWPPAPVTAGGIEMEVQRRDDLTQIKGIGPVYAGRLNEAGIYSFAALAALTPTSLRDRTGLASGQGDHVAWITQARDLAG